MDKIIQGVISIRDKLLFGDLAANISSPAEVSQSIFSSAEPFMLSRFGNVEFAFFRTYYLKHKKLTLVERTLFNIMGVKYRNFSDTILDRLKINAGVFNLTNSDFCNFFNIYEHAIKDVDFYFRWFSGDHILTKIGLQASIYPLEYLNILETPDFYNGVFEGKRLLVISPFYESINQQYSNNYTLLCHHLGVSRIEVEVIKSTHHLTVGQNETWFDELGNLKEKIKNSREGVDYVILGCGAYGMPLASYCKGLGLNALHIGGVTQLLFGINGRRWENLTKSNGLSAFWINALEVDKPEGYQQVENGCYW